VGSWGWKNNFDCEQRCSALKTQCASRATKVVVVLIAAAAVVFAAAMMMMNVSRGARAALLRANHS
jgi:hypothetical protein